MLRPHVKNVLSASLISSTLTPLAAAADDPCNEAIMSSTASD